VRPVDLGADRGAGVVEGLELGALDESLLQLYGPGLDERPSSDMIACAMTLLMEHASPSAALRLVDVHDRATGEGCRFDEVQVS
jgi:hypothetical protein